MKKSKKIFLIIAIIFVIIMILIGIDINSRTTWPGSKKNLPERLTE
ncbi:MAG: ABC-type cobalt transport system substrate-binding protein [Cyclobacteriaceae bacterium]|jgi:ABC-type cobalt transport system substrate-binding protein